jgi:hypothetical protein
MRSGIQYTSICPYKWLQKSADECPNQACKTTLLNAKNPFASLRFHDLRHHAITKLAELQASDATVMSLQDTFFQEAPHYSCPFQDNELLLTLWRQFTAHR